jgi:hypothetical protein
MTSALLTALCWLAAVGAIAGWTMGMYFWYLRDFTSKPGTQAQGNLAKRSFAIALLCTVAAWVLREALTSVTQ